MCEKDTVSTRTCACALTNCGAGRVCVGGTKCEYPGNKKLDTFKSPINEKSFLKVRCSIFDFLYHIFYFT